MRHSRRWSPSRVRAGIFDLALGFLLKMISEIYFRTPKNLIHNEFKRPCGVYRHAPGCVFFRLMQSRNEFPLRWFCAPVIWVQRHSLVKPAVQGVKVNLKDKNAIK
jgi:hypothetical protein